MGHVKDRLSFKSQLRTITVLVFHPAAVLLLLTHCCGGESQEAPLPSVMARRGDNVVLPCHIEPAVDAVGMTVEWGRPDLDPRFVYVRHEGKALLHDQNEAYKGRASLSIDGLKHGDASLQLSKVRTSDTGTYRCYIPKQKKEYFVQLLVGSVSSPVATLAGIDKDTGGVVLGCRSSGWYPEPEVSWLDAEGSLLSAGRPETVRGPDDFYTVSSRVTVEKRHGRTFTCRLTQNNINQTRETHIRVPDDFFMTPSSCAAGTTASVLFALMFILLAVVFVWKQRKHKKEIKKLKENKNAEAEKRPDKTTEQLPLMETKGNTENKEAMKEQAEYLEKKRATLNEELNKNEDEQKETEKAINVLNDRKNELMEQKKQIKAQVDEAEAQRRETENKLKSVEKGVEEEKKDKTLAQAKAYFKLNEMIKQEMWTMDEMKKKYQEVQTTVDKLLSWTIEEFNKMQEKKKKLENHMEKMTKQLEEVQPKMTPS